MLTYNFDLCTAAAVASFICFAGIGAGVFHAHSKEVKCAVKFTIA